MAPGNDQRLVLPSSMSLHFCVTAPSNTGKTSFLCQMIETLVRNGYKVGAIKSCHHVIQSNDSGKDSQKLSMAGADPVFAIANNENVEEYFHHFSHTDICLIEGGRKSELPAVVLYRTEHPFDPKWTKPKNILMHLDISNPQAAVQKMLLWVEQHIQET